MRPSTAPFGNWGVLGALRKLNEYFNDAAEAAAAAAEAEAHRRSNQEALTLAVGNSDARDEVEAPVTLPPPSPPPPPLDEVHEVAGTLFMGRRSKKAAEGAAAVAARSNALFGCPGYVGLSRDDDALVIAEQWAALRTAFLRPGTALVFHLRNHYALIFAMREWEEPIVEDVTATVAEDKMAADAKPAGANSEKVGAANGGFDKRETSRRVVRQVLTARRGQRPSAWIDFEEMRNTMIGWDGYKIMLVARRQ